MASWMTFKIFLSFLCSCNLFLYEPSGGNDLTKKTKRLSGHVYDIFSLHCGIVIYYSLVFYFQLIFVHLLGFKLGIDIVADFLRGGLYCWKLRKVFGCRNSELSLKGFNASSHCHINALSTCRIYTIMIARPRMIIGSIVPKALKFYYPFSKSNQTSL